jgi:hypothetical protein
VTEHRRAVAIHEAGHAVVFAFLGVDVPHVQMGHNPDPSGHTLGRNIPVTDRISFLAPLHAGNVAVEELCGDYRLPIVPSPASDEAQIGLVEAITRASDDEKAQAPARARDIIQLCRDEVVAIAEALLAAPNGRLEGQPLQDLLVPVWAKPRL